MYSGIPNILNTDSNNDLLSPLTLIGELESHYEGDYFINGF